ncbi:MAG: DUF6387 family protein [Gammaproteobacteria bacterium]
MNKDHTQTRRVTPAKHKLAAKKIIRSEKDLPTWFDITKYQAASTMDAKAWHAQLQARAECLQTYEDPSSIVEIFLKTAREGYLASIAVTPLIDCSKSTAEIIKSMFNVEIDNFKSIWEGIYAPTAVHHINIVHAYTALREILTADLYRLLAQWWDKMGPHTDNFFTGSDPAAPEWFDTPVSWRNYALFKINLDAPDDLIVEQCKAVLEKAREDQEVTPPKRCFTAKDFSKWYEFGVLPYCDLTIWANHANLTIPQRVMADAIFVDGEKGEESIRRATVPLVTFLMSREAIYQLHSQFLSQRSASNL